LEWKYKIISNASLVGIGFPSVNHTKTWKSHHW